MGDIKPDHGWCVQAHHGRTPPGRVHQVWDIACGQTIAGRFRWKAAEPDVQFGEVQEHFPAIDLALAPLAPAQRPWTAATF
ncbi:MAG: hypothetical protein V7760_01700 [Marinobacter sp.]